MVEALQTPEKSLFELVGAPFDRETYLRRLSALVDRYERLVRLSDHPSDRGLLVRLLLEHPGALREHDLLDRAARFERLEAAHEISSRQRAGAALPPEAPEARRMLATADLEWIVRELRILRRLGTHRALDRRDPLPLSQEAMDQVVRLNPARILRNVAAVVGARHLLTDFIGYLLPEKRAEGARHRVGLAEEIREGRGTRVLVAGRPIAVFRDGGTLRAIDDTCPHRGGPLSKGRVVGGAAVCPLHAWRFDLCTGEMAGNPNLCLRTYEVVVEEGVVYVVAGDR